MGQDQIYDENAAIDPSLHAMTNLSTPTTIDRIIVRIPEEFVEISNKILIYFAQTLEIPKASEELKDGPTAEMIFTMKELEILEPIDERNPESTIPSIINDICINANPQTTEIEYIIDLRRVRPDCLTFYLAKMIKDNYYWFHNPQTDRDRSLCKLIEEFRHESQGKDVGRKKSNAKKLRSGRTIGI